MLGNLAGTYAPGDTDLAWARVTLWRAIIAAAVEQPPFEPVLSVTSRGRSGTRRSTCSRPGSAHG